MLSAPAHTHTGETPGAHHTDDDTLADAAPVEALSCVDATPRTMSPRPKGLRHTIAVACGKIMGLILLALSAVVFSTLGLFVSVLAPRFSAFEVAALRFYGQTVVTVAMLFVTGAPARVPREKWVWLFLRAFCGSSSMTLFYFAITCVPPAPSFEGLALFVCCWTRTVAVRLAVTTLSPFQAHAPCRSECSALHQPRHMLVPWVPCTFALLGAPVKAPRSRTC